MQDSLTPKPRFMAALWLLMAALAVAGCSSKGSVDPVPPEEETTPEVQPAPPPAPVEEEPRDFDAAGNPLDRNGNPLARTYYFDYDKAVLKPSDLASLELHAQILRRNPDSRVILEGHCDERGTREYNLALGERRADAIRSFLLSAGVAARQLETVSYGEERPEDPGHTEAAWSRNRRAIMAYR